MAADVTTLEELRKCPYKTTIWSVIRKNLPDCQKIAVWPNTSYIENMELTDTWTKIKVEKIANIADFTQSKADMLMIDPDFSVVTLEGKLDTAFE